MRLIRRRWLALATAPVLAASGLLGVTLTASAATHHAARPHGIRVHRASPNTPVTGAPAVFHQEFANGSTKYFCPAGSGNAPCDGNESTASDYGTIDAVQSGFSNGGYGNYAPSTSAYNGKWFALTSGAEVGNQGAGCPQPNMTEFCTGPYALFPVAGETSGDWGNSNVFPSQGFTVTNDLYLAPTTPPGPDGSLVDDDVELNMSTQGSYGYYGVDNVITACYESGSSGFLINFGHNSPGSCESGTAGGTVTADGWYRLVFVFSNVSGYVDLTENVIDESNGQTVATSGPQPVSFGSGQVTTSEAGGPGYFWLPTEDVSGLPLANLAVQLGQHPGGYTPPSSS